VTWQLANAKVWDGSQWQPAVGGGSNNEYEIFDAASVLVTASSTIHTKGAWTEIIASTTIDAGWLVYNYTNFQNGVATTGLLDIGIGAAGAETVLIANLPSGYGNNGTQFTIPINIATGTRISARTQSAVSSRATTVAIGLKKDTHGLNLSTVDTFNADTTTSSFTTALASTYSQLTASTTNAYKAVAIHVAHRTETAVAVANNNRVRLATGASGSETDRAWISRNANSSEFFTFGPVGLNMPGFWVGTINASTRLSSIADIAAANAGLLVYGVR
jgi:hypothetical protein